MEDCIQVSSDWERWRSEEAYTMFWRSCTPCQDQRPTKCQQSTPALVTQTPIAGGLPRLEITGNYSLVYLQSLLDNFRYLSS